MTQKMTIIHKNGTSRLTCECGGELCAAVSYNHSGIPAYLGDEMSGSPYEITVNGDEDLILDLDSFSASYSDSDIYALYCYDCQTTITFDEPGRGKVEITLREAKP